mgnify:FL=1
MPYSIIDVTDQSIKDKLAETCDHQPFIAQAKMVLIFCADYHRWYRKFKMAGCEDIPAPETVREDISLEARLFDGLIRGLSLRESSDELIAQGERKNAVKAAALRVKERLGK